MADDVANTLRKALGKLNSQKAHLDRQISALETALGVLGGPQQTNGSRGGRRMSAAARKAIGRRMRAYWAKRKAGAVKAKKQASK
jgi:truncated hemoglobin YjbI